MTECSIHHGSAIPCEVCALQDDVNQKQKEAAALKGIRDIQIGKRYLNTTFTDFVPPTEEAIKIKTACQRYAATFGDRLAGCDSLLMLGTPGTGKNMLAACICKNIATQGFTALHTTAIKLVRKVKTSWGNSELDEQELIDQFTKPDLLVIDEVGVQFGSPTEKIILFEVINGRYEEMRPTVLISNLTLADAETYLGPRIIDRFYEGKSSLLEFNWASYRRQR
jgi:DNA replication protein DnaC